MEKESDVKPEPVFPQIIEPVVDIDEDAGQECGNRKGDRPERGKKCDGKDE